MTQMAPTFQQIKAQVEALRRKKFNTRKVAIRTKAKWTGSTRHQDGGEIYLIHQCDSPLAMRLALREAGDDATTVLITDLDDSQIGDDILVRLKPRKAVPLSPWEIVKTLFHARTIDPRFNGQNWLAEALLELVPATGFPPVPSGFLDVDTVWSILLKRVIGLDAGCPDLVAILKWSADADNVRRFRSASPVFRDAASQWLIASAGPTAESVLRCIASSERTDALPIGLAAGVVFHVRAKGQLEKAAGKMEERFLSGHSLPQAVIDRWAASSTEVVRLQLGDSRLKQQLLARTDEILREVGAESHAWLSDTSPLGFDLRLAEFGKRLSETLPMRTAQHLETLIAIRGSIAQHDRHVRERRSLKRVDMALRLMRWLMDRDDTRDPKSLAEAACQHLTEDGFVDWARLALRCGDPVRELSGAYSKLFETVTDLRERQCRTFARLLQDWTTSQTTDEMIVPVEQVLERIVAPIATQKPVLVIVIDGMSVAVFRQLMADVLGQEWMLLAEEGIGLRPALATVPSVTEVSRTSLLCGRLAQGNSATEKAGFSEHPALVRACRSGYPPVLFHKAAIHESEDASLASDIRDEICSPSRRIVGVVVNAVDDHLLKGEQIDTHWSRDEIKVLPVLLHEAKTAGRTVIMLSDHGHVLDCHARGQAFEAGGERWRMADGLPADGELRIQGPRVVMPESKTLIAPWTERLHYGIKKNGYHGGVSPQEMVIPIAVLTATGDLPAGWTEAMDDLPAWWDATSSLALRADREPLKVRSQKTKGKQADLLFLLEEVAPPQPAVVASAIPRKEPAWVTALLSSPVFEEQKRLGGRAVPADDVLARLLTALDERGGKITSAALARAIQFAPTRLRGLLAIAQRVLNVDGSLILARDEASDTVELDRMLLARQFDLT